MAALIERQDAQARRVAARINAWCTSHIDVAGTARTIIIVRRREPAAGGVMHGG